MKQSTGIRSLIQAFVILAFLIATRRLVGSFAPVSHRFAGHGGLNEFVRFSLKMA
jgi:hypothetical protein